MNTSTIHLSQANSTGSTKTSQFAIPPCIIVGAQYSALFTIGSNPLADTFYSGYFELSFTDKPSSQWFGTSNPAGAPILLGSWAHTVKGITTDHDIPGRIGEYVPLLIEIPQTKILYLMTGFGTPNTIAGVDIILYTVPVGSIPPKLGHVSQFRKTVRIQDPGASSGSLPTVINFKALSSRVCTLESAREVVVAAVQATLLGAGVISSNAYLFQAAGVADILQSIVEGKVAPPGPLTADDLVSLLSDWVFEGYEKLKKRASVLIDAPAIQQNVKDLYESPYEQALRQLFGVALSQSKPRVWLTSHHRKRIE